MVWRGLSPLLFFRGVLYLAVFLAAVLNIHAFWSRAVRTADVGTSMESVEWFAPSRTVPLVSVDFGARPAGAVPIVIEIADFECPFCARSASQIVPQLKAEVAHEGTGRYLFLNYPLIALHPNALGAARAAECAASQGRFDDMYRELFSTPLRLQPADLTGHATRAGLDHRAFVSCFEAAPSSRLQAQMTDAERLGATGTPTFVFGRRRSRTDFEMMARISGIRPFHVFRNVLDRVRSAR